MSSLFPSQTQPISGFRIQDLNVLLDNIGTGAILLEENRVLIVNARVTELTAFTRREMVGKTFDELISQDEQASDVIPAFGNPKTTSQVFLLTRNNQRVKINASITNINERWKLVILNPYDVPKPDEGLLKNQNEILASMIGLIQTLNINDVDDSITQILELGKNLVDADVFAVYLGNSDKPSASRIASIGDVSGFPVELYSENLTHHIKPTYWAQEESSDLTFLQQSASGKGLSFLATYPIRDVSALVGVIVAGGERIPDPEECTKSLEALSMLLSIKINKSTLIRNLWKNIKINETNNSVLESIKEITSDGIITIAHDLTILEMNKAAELILGFGNHEVQGLEVGEIIIGTSRVIPGIQLSLQGVSTPHLGEINLFRRDGSQFPADVSIVPLQHQSKILGAFIVLRDKSETHQFQVQTHQLEQRALLGEVTAIFAHEVRNPINNISTGLQLLSDEIGEGDPKQEIIIRMRSDCSRLTDLMESVLIFSRSGTYKLVPIEIGGLIKRITNQWSSRMNRLKINHVLNIPDQVFVEGDRRALEQVFTNLISNAIQAMEGLGRGTLAIKVTTQMEGNGHSIVKIDVSDTGPGIPKENIDRIFEPFYTTKTNGTGLGLSITKQIVTAHKGSIKLTSFPGGTVFHLKLPALNMVEDY